jgi:hypothetical protein
MELPPLNRNSSSAYHLSNDPKRQDLKYFLPHKKLLKLSNNNNGFIDTWPANSSNQIPDTTGLSIDKYKRLTLSKDINKRERISKPKFLENLERFLNNELSKLGFNDTNDKTPSEAKLQVLILNKQKQI